MKLVHLSVTLALAFLPKLSAQTSAPSASGKPPVGVPADAKFFNGKWYRVYLEKMPWTNAREKCARLGGQLAAVPDAATWGYLKALTGTACYWLGATDDATPGVWKWVDGTAMSFTAWVEGQPDNKNGSEHFLGTWRGGWNDYPNSAPRDVVGFICQWPRAAKAGGTAATP